MSRARTQAEEVSEGGSPRKGQAFPQIGRQSRFGMSPYGDFDATLRRAQRRGQESGGYAILPTASHDKGLRRGTPFMALIAPSLLAADFARLAEALRTIKSAGASMVHLDVMDGHFVEDITVGQPVVRSLRKATDLVLDLHLLIERPERYIADFVEAGADRISVHAEATTRLHRVLEQIRRQGARAGVALNPATPLETLVDVIGEFDFLSLLSSDPGLSEGTFIPRSVEKVQAAASLRNERRADFAIQVEGGIRLEHLEQLTRAGADILVAGSVIFNDDDPKARLSEMLRLVSASRAMSKA